MYPGFLHRASGATPAVPRIYGVELTPRETILLEPVSNRVSRDFRLPVKIWGLRYTPVFSKGRLEPSRRCHKLVVRGFTPQGSGLLEPVSDRASTDFRLPVKNCRVALHPGFPQRASGTTPGGATDLWCGDSLRRRPAYWDNRRRVRFIPLNPISGRLNQSFSQNTSGIYPAGLKKNALPVPFKNGTKFRFLQRSVQRAGNRNFVLQEPSGRFFFALVFLTY